MDRCRAGNFDDLDFLLKIVSDAKMDLSGREGGGSSHLIQILKDALRVREIIDVKDILIAWKEKRKEGEISAEYLRELFSLRE